MAFLTHFAVAAGSPVRALFGDRRRSPDGSAGSIAATGALPPAAAPTLELDMRGEIQRQVAIAGGATLFAAVGLWILEHLRF